MGSDGGPLTNSTTVARCQRDESSQVSRSSNKRSRDAYSFRSSAPRVPAWLRICLVHPRPLSSLCSVWLVRIPCVVSFATLTHAYNVRSIVRNMQKLFSPPLAAPCVPLPSHRRSVTVWCAKHPAQHPLCSIRPPLTTGAAGSSFQLCLHESSSCCPALVAS